MPVSRLAQAINQDEEIATLIRMFTIGRNEGKNSDSAHIFKAVQSLDMEHRNTDGLTRPHGTYPCTLPPPSPFVRRKKSSHKAPGGPSSIHVDLEPTASKHSPKDVPLKDEYSVVLEFLMSEPIG